MVLLRPIVTAAFKYKGSVCLPSDLTILSIDSLCSSIEFKIACLIETTSFVLLSALFFNFNSKASTCFAMASLKLSNSALSADFSIFAANSTALASIFALASFVASPLAFSTKPFTFSSNSVFAEFNSSLIIILYLILLKI